MELPPVPADLMQSAQGLFNYLNASNDDLIQKLERVYDYLNNFSLFVRTFTTCARGCHYCCYYDIQITTFEAEYIYLKTGIPHSNNTPFTKNNSGPCPFLRESGECGIYNYRPMVCRLLHAAGDPKNCQKGKTQLQYGSEASGFSNLVYKNLISWVHCQTVCVNGELKDIRDFFPYEKLFDNNRNYN